MNLIDLRSTGDWAFTLRLHPKVNVLVVPDDARRARLREMLAGILEGHLDGLEGTFGVDGTEFDLEVDAIAILSLPSDIAITLGPRDLPGAVVIEPPSSVAGVDDTHLALEAGRQAAEQSLADAAATARDLGVALEAERHALDPDIDDALERAREDLSSAEAVLAAVDAAPVVDADPEETEPGDGLSRAELERQRTEIEAERRADEASLAALGPTPDPSPDSEVVAALARLRASRSDDPRPSPDAVALADHWRELSEQLVAFRAEHGVDDETDPLFRAVEEARVELARAENGARPLYVKPDDADELDRAHAAVAEAEERAFRRLTGPLARRRLETAQAAEAELLNRIGVSSYDLYLMRSSPGLVDADAQQQLTAAKRGLADATTNWERARHEATPQEMHAIESELAAVRGRAARMLGHAPTDDTIEDELRTHLEPPDVEGARRALVALIGRLGASLVVADQQGGSEPGHEPDPETDPEGLAERYLAVLAAAQAERAELRRGLADLDRRANELDRAIEAAPPSADPDEQASIVENRAQAKAQARAEAAAAVERAEKEVAALVEREEQAAVSAQHQAHLERELAQAEEALGGAQATLERATATMVAHALAEATREPTVDLSGVGGKDAEFYVLARIAAQRSVGDAGALPLVIDEALRGFPSRAAAPILDLLSRMSGIVQVLYLTADDEIVRWAERLGPDEAAVARFSAPSAAP